MSKTIQFRIESSANLKALDDLINKMGQVQAAATKLNSGKAAQAMNLAPQIAQLSSLSNAATQASAKVNAATAQIAASAAKMATVGTSAAKAATGMSAMGTSASKASNGMSTAASGATKMSTAFSKISTAGSKIGSVFSSVSSGASKVGSAFGKIAGPISSFTQKIASLATPMNKIVQQMSNFASKLASSMSSGLNKAASVAQSFSRNTSAAFAALRSTMSSAGGWFSNFSNSIKTSMDAANRAVKEFYSAGWSLLTSGYMVKNFGGKVGGGMIGALQDYVDYEKKVTQAAIAASGVDPNSGRTIAANPQAIEEIIQNVQRGFANRPPVYAFDATELAEGIYYYTSAIGVPAITEGPGRNIESISQQVSDLMAVASITGTSLETMTKGVMNTALQFGIDVRSPKSAEAVSNIAAQVGYLSNVSTMEVPDIFEAFKNMGPMLSLLSGMKPGDALTSGAGLEDVFSMLYFASEAGLRGSKVGTGLSAAFSSLLNPTNPMLEASTALGTGGTKEGFDKLFFNADNTLKGGIQGFLETLASAPEASQLKLLGEMFTNNATRAMIPQIMAYMKNPAAFSEFTNMMKSGSAEEWMSKAILMTNDTIGGNLQNLANAWDRLQINLIQSVGGPIKTGLQFIADIIWNISDAINNNPWIGKLVAGIGAFVAIVASALGSLMMFGGTILLIMQALTRLGAVGAPLAAIFLGIGRAALTAIPIFGLLAVAMGLLAGAWVTDFMGIRTALTGIVTGTSDMGVKVQGIMKQIGSGIKTVGLAFAEFFTGIVYGRGPIGDLAQALFSFLGPQLGNAMMGKLVALQGYFTGLRKSMEDFSVSASKITAPLKDAGLAIQGFFESVFMGSQRNTTFNAANRLGAMLGIDDLGVKMQVASRSFRSSLEEMLGSVVGFGRAVGSQFASIFANLRQVFTVDNLLAGLSAVGAFIQGIAIGAASVFMGFLQAINMVTEALTHMGDAGRFVADLIQQYTGLELSLNGIARAAGVAVGAFLGFRALSFLSPLVGIVTTLGAVVSKAALGLVQFAVQAAAMGAQIAFSTAALAVNTVQWVANAAAKVSSAVASTALAAAEGVAAGATTGLAAAAALAESMFGLLAITMFSVIAIAAAAVLVFVGIGVAMLAAVAYSQGLSAAWAGLLSMISGIMAGLSVLVGFLQMVAAGFNLLVSAIDSVAGSGAAFYAIGLGIGLALSAIAIAAAVATAALIAFGASAVVAWVGALGPIGLFVAAIAVAGVAIYLFRDQISDALNGIGDIFGNLGGTWQIAWAGILDGLDLMWQGFINSTKQQWNNLAGAIGGDSLKFNIEPIAANRVSTMLAEQGFQTSMSDSIVDNVGGALDAAGNILWYTHGGPLDAGFANIGKSGGTSLMTALEDKLKGTPLEGVIGKLTDTDWSKAWGTDSMDVAMGSMEDYSYLLDDTMKKWQEQAKAYQEYAKLVKAVGRGIADEMYLSEGKAIPSDPGSLGEYLETQAQSVKEGTASLQDALDAANKVFSDAFQSMSAPDLTAKLFDIGSGTAGKGKSAGGILASLGESILSGVQDKPDWLDWTELLADAAGTFDLNTDLLGKNLHTALAPALELTASQLGIDVQDMLANVPTFYAPPELVPMATAEFLTGLQGIPESVYKGLDTIGIDQGWTDVGTKWSDLVDFASAKAIQGKDWNFADFLVESYGISMSDAQSAMADLGIDPGVVTQDMFGDTAAWAQSMGGQLTVVTEEMFNQAQTIMAAAGDNVISLTKEQLAGMDDNLKLYLDSMGYMFKIVGADDSELALASDAEQKSAAINAYGEKINAAFAGLAADAGHEGSVAGFADGFKSIVSQVEEGGVALQTVFTDLDGTQITMPAVDALPLLESMNQGSEAVANFHAMVQEHIVPTMEGLEAGFNFEGPIEEINRWSRTLSDGTEEVIVTMQDLDGTTVEIPAAVYDAYLASLTTVNEATKTTGTVLADLMTKFGAKQGLQIGKDIQNMNAQSNMYGTPAPAVPAPPTEDEVRTQLGLPTTSAIETAKSSYVEQVSGIQTAATTALTTDVKPIDISSILKVDPASFATFGSEISKGITDAISMAMAGGGAPTGGSSSTASNIFKPILDNLISSLQSEFQGADFKSQLGSTFQEMFSGIFESLTGSTATAGMAAGGGKLSFGDSFALSMEGFAKDITTQMSESLQKSLSDPTTGVGSAISEAFSTAMTGLSAMAPSGGGQLTAGMSFGASFTGFAESIATQMKTSLSTALSTSIPEALQAAFSEAFAQGMSGGIQGPSPISGAPLGGAGIDVSGFATTISTQLGTELKTALGPQINQAINGALSGAFSTMQVSLGEGTGGPVTFNATNIATSIATQIGTQLKTALATEIPKAISEAMSGGLQGPSPTGAPLGGMSAMTIKIPVELDTASFGAATTALTSAIAALSLTQKVKVGVELDTMAFGIATTTLSTAIAALTAMSTITVTATLTDNASSPLGQLIGLVTFYGGMAPSPTLSIIDNASAAIGGIIGLASFFSDMNPTTTATVIDNGSAVISNIIGLMNSVQSKTVTLTVNTIETVSRVNGTVTAGASGGLVQDKMTLVGEHGPEFVELPKNSRIFSNAASNNLVEQMNASLAGAQSADTQAARSVMPITAGADLKSVMRAVSAQQDNKPQPITVHIDNINIDRDVNIDEVLKKVDRATGYRMELSNRGMEPTDDIRR